MVNGRLDEALAVIHRILTSSTLPDGATLMQWAGQTCHLHKSALLPDVGQDTCAILLPQDQITKPHSTSCTQDSCRELQRLEACA